IFRGSTSNSHVLDTICRLKHNHESGGSEKRFYKQLIAKADKRFTAHCERLEQEEKQRKQREKERKRK
ncbi:MAG TPA: hypothetical protein VFU53_01080, partial [Burkholderiales bacterium]|nr:hypothetical protein [Burkholderiales bacterium]